ncbi:MAG: TlpA family protein disulfide reductase, partial [Muribaculaceae bacterium]|nr:TlpA family protein disulfide reductase [Muribaculaceae bacterium]
GRVMHYRDSLDLQGLDRAKSEQLIDLLKSGELKKYNDVKSHYLNWIFDLNEGGYPLSSHDSWNIPFENDIVDGIFSFREDNDSIISAFHNKYEDSYLEWNFEKDIDKGIENFEKRYGKKSAIINQLFASNAYINHIDRRNILTDGYIANCRKRLPDMFYDYVMDQNSAMAKVLESAKSNILEMNPENSGDQVLKDLAEKFKGKVIYIDIWGTWCSPCLSAITEIQPVKKDYAENVAFVYLADETSPQKAWEEKIKSIEGEHMRLSQAQAQDIKSKFALSGYPSYIVIGKDGSVSYSGFIHGLDNVRKILDEAISK